MIEAVNAISSGDAPDNNTSEDPMAQIAQILSSHLESLQWIDGAVKEVEGKVGDVEKKLRTIDGSGGANAAGLKSSRYGLGR